MEKLEKTKAKQMMAVHAELTVLYMYISYQDWKEMKGGGGGLICSK